MLWKEKERSRVRAVLMDNLKSWLGIRKMDRVPKARITKLCRIEKEVGLATMKEWRMIGLLKGYM